MRPMTRLRPLPAALALVLVGPIAACRNAPGDAPKPAPPAKVDNAKPEGALATVTLTDEAERHLGIKTEKVVMEDVRSTRTVGGEATVPAGRSVVVTAPAAGTLAAPAKRPPALGPVSSGEAIFELLPLQSDRNLRADAERDVHEADARLTEATQRLQRLEQLLAEGSASQRSVEEARAARAVAAATAEAAKRRLESTARLPIGPRGELALTAPFNGMITAIRAAPGQTVAAGAPIAEIAQLSQLWIRVPLYPGDLTAVDVAQAASVARLGEETTGPWHTASRIAGPPAADPSAASVDLFFQIDNASRTIRPGERLTVRLPLKASERALVVPQSAVIYDVGGGAWVYELRSPHVYARRRVELRSQAGDRMIVARGLAEGLTIVTVGAAELYSTEFYVNK